MYYSSPYRSPIRRRINFDISYRERRGIGRAILKKKKKKMKGDERWMMKDGIFLASSPK